MASVTNSTNELFQQIRQKQASSASKTENKTEAAKPLPAAATPVKPSEPDTVKLSTSNTQEKKPKNNKLGLIGAAVAGLAVIAGAIYLVKKGKGKEAAEAVTEASANGFKKLGEKIQTGIEKGKGVLYNIRIANTSDVVRTDNVKRARSEYIKARAAQYRQMLANANENKQLVADFKEFGKEGKAGLKKLTATVKDLVERTDIKSFISKDVKQARTDYIASKAAQYRKIVADSKGDKFQTQDFKAFGNEVKAGLKKLTETVQDMVERS